MSNKALVLSFKDAKIWEYGETFFHSRKAFFNQNRINVPVGTLYYKHVANVLQVLMSERPVSTFWGYSMDKFDPRIEAAAKKAMIRIDTPIIQGQYPKEMVATNKPSAQSWMKAVHMIKVGSKTVPVVGAYPTWDIIVGYFGTDNFKVFKDMCDSLCGVDCTSVSFTEFIKEYGEHEQIIDFAEGYAKEHKLGQFLNFIRNWAFNKKAGKKLSLVESKYPVKFTTAEGCGRFMSHVHYRLNPKGVETARIISGAIVVPVDDNLLNKVASGSGCATILEGGVVSITDVKRMSDNLVFGYNSVWMGE